MCGFTGSVSVKPINNSLISEANSFIECRGPDAKCFIKKNYNEFNINFHFNRLSILDLSIEGMQPFEYDNVKVFMNGEIYNYIELKERHVSEFTCRTGCDVEIIPFLYRKYGMNFLNHLNP